MIVNDKNYIARGDRSRLHDNTLFNVYRDGRGRSVVILSARIIFPPGMDGTTVRFKVEPVSKEVQQ